MVRHILNHAFVLFGFTGHAFCWIVQLLNVILFWLLLTNQC